MYLFSGTPDSSSFRPLLPILAVLVGLWAFATAGLAQHPTAVTSLVNSAQDTTLEVNHNGSLFAPGTYNPTSRNDSIPATGAGTRMMWYPAKAAFRAGRIGVSSGKGDVWDADSVGAYSVAFGQDTRASGGMAAAMGWETTASGSQSTAMGSQTTASGFRSTAMGDNTTASSFRSMAMGRETRASGSRSTAMGSQTTASGTVATAMGLQTTAATPQSLSIGQYNSANSTSDNTLFVAGNGTSSSPSDALVLDKNGDMTIAGTLTESSDRRLKTAIELLDEEVLGALREIDPVRFRFEDERTHPSGEQIGLIAQEVQNEFPALVSKDADGYLSLAYPKLTAVLLKGLKEQQATIETQDRQIERLHAECKRSRH